VTVGEAGSGSLVIEAGAEASMNTGLDLFGLTIGDQAGSTGTLLVTGPGSRLDAYVSGWTIVGNDGTGSLTVTNHGFVELGYTVADYDDGNGSIAVTGTGSTLEMRYGLELGGDVATGGTGVLSVSAGAQAVVIGGGIALGYAADTAGTISVSGAHSTLNIGTNEVDVGIDGTGTLLVTGGGLVKATGISQGIILGDDDRSGSFGYALVSGAGSDIVDTGAFTVGGLGTGTLTIAADGRVSAASLATSESATAAISLSGVGSALAVTGLAQFGGTAATAISIGSGSVLSAATAVVQDAGISLTGGTLSVSKTLTTDAGQGLAGTGTLNATSLINAGTIESAGGTLSFIGKISGPGTLAVGSASTLSLSGAVGSGQSALFGAATGTLALASPTQFAATIEDFVKGDVIDLSGIVAKSLTFANGKLTVHEINGSSLGLSFSGAYSTGSFAAPTSDGHGGTLIQHS
jgi:T5SS/PEP-CTERM-associated repeat protein